MRTLLFLPVILAACASPPPPSPVTEYKHQDLIIDRHVQAMSRNQIIDAVHECEGNGLRATMVYGKRKINGFTADVVVDVMCAPKYKFF